MRIGRSIAAWSMALALGSYSASALDPNTRITQYRHRAWRVADGLFESAPNAVAQTTDGYIWIGTGSGLVKFDGVRFAPWTPPPGKSLANPNIISLLGSSDGTLWIGTASGLLSWKNNDLREQLRYRINGIIQDRKGRIWAARSRSHDSGGLCQVKGEHPECVGADDQIKLPNAVSIAEDLHGNLWIGGATQLLRWREGSFETYFREQLAQRNGTNGIGSVVTASDGSVWASIPGEESMALIHIVDGRSKPVVLAGVKTQSFQTLFVDRQGSLWLGSSDNGLYRLYGGRVDHFGAADGLSSNTVISLFEDREGNLWVATSKGLDFFRDSRVITLSASEGLSSDHAGSVLATDDGTVWIGNRGYLDAFRGGQITSVRIPGKRVTALLQDHARRLWVGIDNMLTFYEQGQFHKVNRPDGSPLGTTTAMAEDREQNIWAVANPDRKLFRIRDRRVQEEFDESRIPIARAVAAHPSGGVWLGFLDSFGHYRNGKLDVIRTNGGPRLAVESNGSVWAATRGGLVRWKDGRAETLTSKNGLPCDLIYNVIHDDHARLWLYAKCGLIGIADTELERWWRQPGIVIQAQLLDALDGAMPGSNTFHPGVTKSPDGRLWFVHEAVVQMFDPNRVSQTGSAPPVYVEQVRADRKDYGNNGPFRLPPRTRDLEISYTALSYSIPEKVRFRYKLDGRDREWQEVGSRRQAFYSDLPPGEYAFHVTASNGDGVWNESGGRIEFSVAPAYYQTTWFRALCAAVLIVFVGAAYRFRLWQVQRESGKLRDVIETVPAYAWSALPDGSVDFVNRRWQEFSGVSLDQTLNWGWEKAIHPEDLGRFVEAWHAAVASGSTMEAEARVRRADGQYRWLLIRSVPLRDKTGKIVKWYGVSTDIDDRKRAEQALRRSEAYLAETQRLTHTGTYAADYTTAPLYWSEEMFRIFGFDPEDGLPTRDQPLKRVHPEDLEKFEQAWNRVITRKIDANVEYRIVLPGGTVKHAYGLGHPVLNADGELIEIVGTTVDITERKRAEEERERLRQLEADLAHINRVSMMGELAASIAHEVNQPLSGIVSNGGACLRWLAQDPPEVEEVREAVRDIVRDGKRAGEVIARIRALTRRTAPPPKEKLDLNASIRGVLAIVADEAKRTGVAVRTRFADDLFCVYGDHVQMQQVVLNLVMNAIEAMNGLAGRARQLVITTRNLDPDQACVTVEDSGVGMDRDTMAKIFEPFYTTKSGGMGMGLSISRSIVQNHGGRLWATANDGPGTSFHFSVPKYQHEGSQHEGSHAGVAGV